MMKWFALLLAGLGLQNVAQAQLPRIALAGGYVPVCGIQDVRDKLIATTRFSAVDVLDVLTSTPSLAVLQTYDAVLTWTNADYFDRTTLGNNLADYVDLGGGVVVSTFANAAGIGGRYIGGRWLTGGYEVIASQSNFTSTPASLGAIYQPGHPVMANVTALTATYAARPNTLTLVQGTILAAWNDGKILAAVGSMPGRVDLGLFPPSSDCIGVYWDSQTDGTNLIANALEYVSLASFQYPAFCDPADVNSTGVPGVLTGTPVPTSPSGLHLEAMSGPPTQFGYVLIGTGVSDPGLQLSQGHLCLSVGGQNQIGRYNVPGGVWNSIGRFSQAGVLENLTGTSTTGTGYDVPVTIPITGGPSITAGQTWHFQLWYREASGNSNFTNGVSVQF